MGGEEEEEVVAVEGEGLKWMEGEEGEEMVEVDEEGMRMG